MSVSRLPLIQYQVLMEKQLNQKKQQRNISVVHVEEYLGLKRVSFIIFEYIQENDLMFVKYVAKDLLMEVTYILT